MNDLLADTSSIATTATNIDEAAGNAITIAGQVLATAESTAWQGQANRAFNDAVETFRQHKDRLAQLLTEIGGNVDMAGKDHMSNEDMQVSGMQAKAGMMG